MAISKDQPMRPALNDCVDFLNNNLDIEGVENGINALTSRVTQLENDFRLRCLKGSVEERDQPLKHTFVEIELPQNVNYETDVIACFPSGNLYEDVTPIAPDAITNIPQCYTRFINYYYDETAHKVVFHWYPSSTTTSTLAYKTYVYQGNIIYIERSA